MRKSVTLRCKSPFADNNVLEVALTDAQVTLTIPDRAGFRIDTLESAEELKQILEVYIAYQKLIADE